ncbi:hypothetical protein BMI85_10155 [Thioclava sp. DLFJ4-1]|nr:hypothetical protein BMI85_10155 [Thioclava sp. DLFJ4-1]
MNTPHHPRPHRLERSARRIFYCSIGHKLDDLRVDQMTGIIRRGMRWTARGSAKPICPRASRA